MPITVEFIVPIPIVPIDKKRQDIVNDFRSPILSANTPHKRVLKMKKSPYVADMAPASAFDIPKALSTSTKTKDNVDEAVT
jgi:hypothetical protein